MKYLFLILLISCASTENFWHEKSAFKNNHPQVVIEIPAGTIEKYEIDKKNGGLKIDQRDGKPRLIKFLSYPANYGMIPQTLLPKNLGGDGDPLLVCKINIIINTT